MCALTHHQCIVVSLWIWSLVWYGVLLGVFFGSLEATWTCHIHYMIVNP